MVGRLQGKGLGLVKLPAYFYDLQHNTDEGRPRWVDQFPTASNLIITTTDPYAAVERDRRNSAYKRWIGSFYTKNNGIPVPTLKQCQMRWQAIRVLRSQHSETSSRDWWERYQDCLFRVFVQPQTLYAYETGAYKQWYLLCPEDGYMVNRHEATAAGHEPPTRDYFGTERYLSKYKHLRRARLIPTECCHHLWNEGNEYQVDL